MAEEKERESPGENYFGDQEVGQKNSTQILNKEADGNEINVGGSVKKNTRGRGRKARCSHEKLRQSDRMMCR